jgi:spore maturation protein CgeB
MKKILISSSIENIIPLEKTFRALGYDARLFDYNLVVSPFDEYFFKPANNLLRNIGISKNRPVGRESKYRGDRCKATKLAEVLREFRPDILLHERGLALPAALLRDAKTKYGVKLTVAWWTKGLQWVDMAVNDARLFDYYFFIHRSFAEACRSEGIDNCYYLPYAVDKDLFRKMELSDDEKRKYACDVAFVGGWFPNRQEIMEEISAGSDVHLKIWGPKWRRKNITRSRLFHAVAGSCLYGAELVKQYHAAKINLNISKWLGKSDSGLNLRIFEIPRCCGFLLTDYIEELDGFYRVGREIETYKDIGELKDKIRFYLKNDTARQEIARRGYERAMKMPGWDERIREMMDLISESSGQDWHA